MEKFFALNETSGGTMRQCNKTACAGCHHKQEIVQPAVASQAADNKTNILQLYYAALIQYHSSRINIGNKDTGYLHCT